jgi:hypothetical protein
MELLEVLKGVNLIASMLVGAVILILTYEVAETGSFEDACIQITNLIKGFMRR